MKKALALVLLALSAAATADTFECDAVSQLNRPAPNGSRSVLPVTFEFSKYGAYQQDSNNGSETHYGEAEYDGIGYYHTSEDGRVNLRQEVEPGNNRPIVIAYFVGTDAATVYSNCKLTATEE
ncbi:hypothetical protein [Morganella morganii]|uniref:hypothetical protein n=1 Tax=Morganella morganii TaxID=582 RepID=UPI00229045FC|nr:hypothetical protein [Morganella morganii]HDS3819094.1 hypothetical protein [Morganella morganii subsp. morganii]